MFWTIRDVFAVYGVLVLVRWLLSKRDGVRL